MNICLLCQGRENLFVKSFSRRAKRCFAYGKAMDYDIPKKSLLSAAATGNDHVQISSDNLAVGFVPALPSSR